MKKKLKSTKEVVNGVWVTDVETPNKPTSTQKKAIQNIIGRHAKHGEVLNENLS
uniref:Uncharacterized protein n=1 Tax=viral metagenome TaxID=1070528 RepID=A0A6M3J2P4_9ZZZZ